MRHLRILGLCLVAMLAMSATTYVVASPAMASCNQECKEQKQKEKQEAKEQKEKEKSEAKAQKTKEKEEAQEKKALETGVGDPWGVNNFHAYQACPWQMAAEWKENPPAGITDCFDGITLGGKEGGYFEYGHVKVPLSKAVRLQGGFRGAGSEIEVVPNLQPGFENLEAPPLPVANGIKVITPEIQEIAKWPQALKESYSNALKNGENAVFAKIEMAGDECVTTKGCLDTEDILFEEGVAFRLPLKVKVSGPWLETLGSGPCYIGNDENPVHINLTTEGAGTSGALAFNENFTSIFLKGSKLVDFKWHIPLASGANGCGGEYESYIDEALNIALEVENGFGFSNPNKTGIVVLKGDLHDGSASAVTKEAEAGNV